ncbi:hypothetical protein BCR34DRAFT_57079 [Clohesyomyces aquaticus]|uniref:Uncharacterized protein n=1 Tax=Clohesyomyces aquaticus TaxID=1231657 RepID=A0A1Y1Z2F9_9PLEO|nr:hypothetical protein BCR34DRAFT_57079 [Clohesyomyces aquaticus]
MSKRSPQPSSYIDDFGNLQTRMPGPPPPPPRSHASTRVTDWLSAVPIASRAHKMPTIYPTHNAAEPSTGVKSSVAGLSSRVDDFQTQSQRKGMWRLHSQKVLEHQEHVYCSTGTKAKDEDERKRQELLKEIREFMRERDQEWDRRLRAVEKMMGWSEERSARERSKERREREGVFMRRAESWRRSGDRREREKREGKKDSGEKRSDGKEKDKNAGGEKRGGDKEKKKVTGGGKKNPALDAKNRKPAASDKKKPTTGQKEPAVTENIKPDANKLMTAVAEMNAATDMMDAAAKKMEDAFETENKKSVPDHIISAKSRKPSKPKEDTFMSGGLGKGSIKNNSNAMAVHFGIKDTKLSVKNKTSNYRPPTVEDGAATPPKKMK